MPEVTGTVNLEHLLDLPESSKHVVLEGSTRSGKTIAIFQFLIIEAIENANTIIRVFRHDSTTHNSTTIPSFKLCMGPEMFNGWDSLGSFNKTEKIYTFTNGSKICFDGTSDPMKLHGKESDISWFNEVTEITWEAYKQIANRCRDLKIYDFNPSISRHWIFLKILSRSKKVHGSGKKFNCGESGISYIHSTYIDNPCLTPSQVDEIESSNPNDPENVRSGTADSWFWDVYGLGKRGKIKGAVFQETNYDISEYWPDREICQRWGFGLDFGFSDDPMALIEMRVYNNQIYMKDLVYETGLLVTKNMTKPYIPSLEHKLIELNIPKDADIVADCARPDSITELQLAGYNCIPCTKGDNSIERGINILKSYLMRPHIDSNNLITELEQYKYKKLLRDDDYTDVPEDKNNHLIDAARYWAMRNIPNQKAIMRQNNSRKIKVKSRARGRR